MNEELENMIQEQKEYISKLEKKVEGLEKRVSAGEKETADCMNKLNATLTKNHWLTILILVGVVLLLGTE